MIHFDEKIILTKKVFGEKMFSPNKAMGVNTEYDESNFSKN